jgi:hypothetical protein
MIKKRITSAFVTVRLMTMGGGRIEKRDAYSSSLKTYVTIVDFTNPGVKSNALSE